MQYWILGVDLLIALCVAFIAREEYKYRQWAYAQDKYWDYVDNHPEQFQKAMDEKFKIDFLLK